VRRPPRWFHNLLILTAGTTVAALVGATLPRGGIVPRLSTGTAHASFVLLTVALLMGPWRVVVRRRPHPLSTHSRRDVGIWAAAFALVHSVLGLTVHGTSPWGYFVKLAGDPPRWWPRVDVAGAANYTGLAATLLALLLLSISSDAALAGLGADRWKLLQRGTYLLAACAVVHGFVYQFLERRQLRLVAALMLTTAILSAGQLLGLRHFRRLPRSR
jgi:DMSO/TMAO reductase YedYZ heme-binding membrane subunit